MSPTAIVSHPDCSLHNPGPDHQDQPRRLAGIVSELSSGRFSKLVVLKARKATDTDLLRVHSPELITKVRKAEPRQGLWNIEHDTVLSPGSEVAARLAAGAVMTAVDALLEGQCRNAFCLVRPPGHHAERSYSMGYCIYNNICVGAAYASACYGLRRVAIIDFDAHHGNGAQNIFWNSRDYFISSIHEWSEDMLTGAADETGAYGHILNVPLPSHADSITFRNAVTHQLVPRLHDFSPQLILVAAGFDGHADDRISTLRFAGADFYWIAELLCEIADLHCDGRIIASLEGGYHLPSLTSSALQFISGMIRNSDRTGS